MIDHLQKKRFRWEFWLASSAFLILTGTLFHFIYDWSGENFFVAWFSPVNESIWEHQKLLYFPSLLLLIGELLLQKHWSAPAPSLLFAQTVGTLSGILFIVAFYYTYSGILGQSIDWVNIFCFSLGCILSQLLTALWMQSEKLSAKWINWICYGIWILLLLLFVWFTFLPPMIPLFADPQNGSFGI